MKYNTCAFHSSISGKERSHVPTLRPARQALFTFHGQVVRGKRLGSRLGFPTANIAYDPRSRAWPREGVYAGVARLDGESRGYVSIINQGRHPTVPEGIATVEAHLLGHAHSDLYGRGLTLAYCRLPQARADVSLAGGAQGAAQAATASAPVRWAGEHAPALVEGLDTEAFSHQA